MAEMFSKIEKLFGNVNHLELPKSFSKNSGALGLQVTRMAPQRLPKMTFCLMTIQSATYLA